MIFKIFMFHSKILNWPKTTLLQRMTYYNSFLSPITSYSLIINFLTPIIIDIYWFMFLFSQNTFSHINIFKYTCILTHSHTCIHLYTHLFPLSTTHCQHPKLIYLASYINHIQPSSNKISHLHSLHSNPPFLFIIKTG